METNAQYFDCLCRTCMNKVETSSHDGNTKPQQQWLSIFDTSEECGEVLIAELLSDAVPQIVVHPSDELPKKICTECLQRLLSVYQFQQMCVQSDKQMHELLAKKETVLKSPVLKGAIKGDAETNDADSQPLKDLRSRSTKKETVLKSPVLKGAIKGDAETNDADSQPLKDLRSRSTLQNLQQPSIQEPLADVTVHTLDPEAAQSSTTDHLLNDNQLLEHCNDTQGEFEEFIKNEPIENDEANSEFSDGDTMHSIISVTKDEVLPMEFENQQLNDASSRHNCHLCNKSYKSSENLTRHLNNHKKKANDKKEYCFACHLCSKSYKKQPSLTRHLNLAHSKEPQFTCDFCNKSFASSSGLGQHILTHTGERAYLSPQSVPGEQHTTYAEDKPYECPHCPLRFNTKSNLTTHKIIHEEIKRHKCSICEKTFRLKNNLKMHKRVHSKEKPHKCDVCEKRFAEMEHLKAHIRTHTGEKPYKCKYCERGFAARSLLSQHLRTHLGKNIHRCKFCPLAFRLAAEMRLHLTSHKNEDPDVRDRNLKALQEVEVKLELKFSKEETKGQSREEQQQQKLYAEEIVQQSTGHLAEHRNIHSEDKEDKRYECPCCPLKFASKAVVARHKKSHEEAAKRYECDICGKKLRSKQILLKHKLIHSGEKPHKCNFCEKRFALLYELLSHNRIHTGEKPYKCKYCEHAYTTNSALLKHSRRHLGVNVYRCKFCPLAFPSVSEMRLHLTTHRNEDKETRERNLKALHEEEAKLVLKLSKERAERQSTDSILAEQRSSHAEEKYYECPYCPLRFTSKKSASRHKTTIHEGIKEHECDLCGKKFGVKSTLRTHKLSHSEGKPHKCDFCEKRFAQMQQLKVHIRTHTGEKPLKCKYCERGFAAFSILSKHLRGHLGKNIHRCNFCPLAFPLAAEMRLHLASHKNEDPETRERNLKALQEEEVKLKLKFSKDKSKGQSTEEQQEKNLCKNETEQQATVWGEYEEFIKNEPIEDDKTNRE